MCTVDITAGFHCAVPEEFHNGETVLILPRNQAHIIVRLAPDTPDHVEGWRERVLCRAWSIALAEQPSGKAKVEVRGRDGCLPSPELLALVERLIGRKPRIMTA